MIFPAAGRPPEAPSLFQFRRFFPVLALIGASTLAASAQSTDATQNTQTATEAQQIATPQPQQQSTQQRALVLREAQQRVMARRHLRERQVIQDTYTHKYEVYGGGGYLRFRPGHDLQHNTNAAWNAGVTDWFHGKLGATIDARGYYGTAITDNYEYQVFKPAISQYTFMAGPQYRFFEGLHWGWSAQVLAGVAHNNFSTGTGGFPATLVGLYPDANKLAVSAGAAVDYNLSPVLALRLMPNYLMTTYGSDVQENLGFTVGIVYRFGRQ
jgi:opacity protein-like surface antigen